MPRTVIIRTPRSIQRIAITALLFFIAKMFITLGIPANATTVAGSPFALGASGASNVLIAPIAMIANTARTVRTAPTVSTVEIVMDARTALDASDYTKNNTAYLTNS